MKKDTQSKETTSRREFTKAAAIAAVAAPVAALLAACAKPAPQNGSSGQASPAASPSPTEEKRDEGSPITVGGGGGLGDAKATGMNNSCIFDENDYPEPLGDPGPKHFRHPGWQIKTFKISTKDGIQDHSDLLPQSGNCLVIVKCKGGGPKEDVTINGKDFGIDMDTTVYPKNPNGTVHTNPNAASYISQVILNTGTNLYNYGPFKKDDNCAVCTDHIENSPKCAS